MFGIKKLIALSDARNKHLADQIQAAVEQLSDIAAHMPVKVEMAKRESPMLQPPTGGVMVRPNVIDQEQVSINGAAMRILEISIAMMDWGLGLEDHSRWMLATIFVGCGGIDRDYEHSEPWSEILRHAASHPDYRPHLSIQSANMVLDYFGEDRI